MANEAIHGVGALIVDGQRYHDVQYRIEVKRNGPTRLKALGVLTTLRENMSGMVAALSAGVAHIELKGGDVIQIAVSRMRFPSDPPSFEFEAAGPLPGYR